MPGGATVSVHLSTTSRRSANHKILAELADDAELRDLAEHANSEFERMIGKADDHGVGYPFLLAAKRASKLKWWGTPGWSARVETFMAAVNDPTHPHRRGGINVFPEPWPGPPNDHATLKELLLDMP